MCLWAGVASDSNSKEHLPPLGNESYIHGGPLDCYARLDRTDCGINDGGLSLFVRYGYPMHIDWGVAEVPTWPWSLECWVEGEPYWQDNKWLSGGWKLCTDFGQPSFHEVLEHINSHVG